MKENKTVKLISKILTVLNFIILVSMWIYTIVTWFQLPETVAIHFGLDGKPDGYGSRNINFLLAGINTAIFVMLLYMAKNPYAPGLNIPDSLRRKPELTELFVQGMLLIIMIMFANIAYESNLITLGKSDSLSLFLPFLLGFMFIYMFGFFWIVNKLDKKTVAETPSDKVS